MTSEHALTRSGRRPRSSAFGLERSSSASAGPRGRRLLRAGLPALAVLGLVHGPMALAQGGTTTRVSVDSAGIQGNHHAYRRPSISGDGRWVAFDSYADNLVPGDTNGELDIFLRDRDRGKTARVSIDSAGNQGDSFSHMPSISSDGNCIAFGSDAGNLVPGDTNYLMDVFVHDRQTAQTTRVSVDSAGLQANWPSYYPSISADGRCVAFRSSAYNLVPGDTNGVVDTFVHDLQTGQTTRVSVDSAGNQANDHSFWLCSMSMDGHHVAFLSDATNLVPGDTNHAMDVFVHDRQDCASSTYAYCTAKTTSSGCTPTMGFSGVPSATAPSGFVLTASQVEPSRPGILIYSASGPYALPFYGGLLCIRPPLKRTGVQSTGSAGSPPCTGLLSTDLNAAGICATIGTGYRGWVQVWFRDPPSATGYGLTDAVGFTVCP